MLNATVVQGKVIDLLSAHHDRQKTAALFTTIHLVARGSARVDHCDHGHGVPLSDHTIAHTDCGSVYHQYWDR